MLNLNTLNETQKTIALDIDGAILVTAGAGSGKTRLLTNRIYYLIYKKNISPNNILAITFTNKATNEMKDRIRTMLNGDDNVWISTFHSLCVKILRNDIYNLEGYTRYFSIYDEADKDKIIKNILKEKNIFETELNKKIATSISHAKNQGLTPKEYFEENIIDKDAEVIFEIYSQYEKALKKNNSLDFDDLLIKTHELLITAPEVLEYYRNKFKYILVDEFQDTNLVQYKLIKLFAEKHKNIFVVGDEDQCIYCWRGANIDNIKNFIKDFNCKIYKLEQNYRSTKNIIDRANILIRNNTSRIDKILFTENESGEEIVFYSAYNENEEAEYIANKIYNLLQIGVNPKEIAVLMRVSALSRLIEEKLLNYNIPYKVSGLFKFFDRAEIKNILAYLRLVINPKDSESLKRIINFPKRNIGVSSIEKLQEISDKTELDLIDVILNYKSFEIPNALKLKLSGFSKLINKLKENYENLPLSEFVKFVVEEAKIKNAYNSKSDEDTDRLMNIDQLIQSVYSFEMNNLGKGLIDYLESVTLQNEIEELDSSVFKISVSTIHAAKGLEFDNIFVMGAEEGRIPLNRALEQPEELEEERRLMYVAITRAKKRLIITRAKTRFLYGKTEKTFESRFVKEMGLIKDEYSKNMGRLAEHNFPISRNTTDKSIQNTNSFNKSNFDIKQELNRISDFANKVKQKALQKEFQVGTEVNHLRFGAGKIIKREENFVSVDFGKLGVKSLSLDFAPLQIKNKRD